jgi:hypothetical protein
MPTSVTRADERRHTAGKSCTGKAAAVTTPAVPCGGADVGQRCDCPPIHRPRPALLPSGLPCRKGAASSTCRPQLLQIIRFFRRPLTATTV